MKNFIKYFIPHGIIEYRRSLRGARRLDLHRRKGASTTELFESAKRSSATLFNPNWLKTIETVVDVGANTGQWASAWLMVVPTSRVLSLEPNPDTFAELQKAQSDYSNWNSLNVGAGESQQTLHFNVPNDSTSSSFLEPITEAAWNDPNDIINIRSVVIPVDTIDSITKEWSKISLLKIDVEGYELQTLRGATEALKKTDFVLIELSWHERFVGGSTAWKVNELLEKNGFLLWGISETTFFSGRAAFCDGLYVKRSWIQISR